MRLQRVQNTPSNGSIRKALKCLLVLFHGIGAFGLFITQHYKTKLACAPNGGTRLLNQMLFAGWSGNGTRETSRFLSVMLADLLRDTSVSRHSLDTTIHFLVRLKKVLQRIARWLAGRIDPGRASLLFTRHDLRSDAL